MLVNLCFFVPPLAASSPSLLSHWPQDYTVDIEQFKQLPGVRDSSCPAEFMELAFICCNVCECHWEQMDGCVAVLFVLGQAASHWSDCVNIHADSEQGARGYFDSQVKIQCTTH